MVTVTAPLDLEDPQFPRSLRMADYREARRTTLLRSSMQALTAYTARLRAARSLPVPEFDPADGGVSARVLFLLEKPSPATLPFRTRGRLGSGFTSRDNDNGTAETIFHFMREAGIARKVTVLWNLVPWWNGSMTVTGEEKRSGVACLPELLSLLPRLRAVVFVGRQASWAAPQIASYAPDLGVIHSLHPSPQVRASMGQRWKQIPLVWSQVHPYLDDKQTKLPDEPAESTLAATTESS